MYDRHAISPPCAGEPLPVSGRNRKIKSKKEKGKRKKGKKEKVEQGKKDSGKCVPPFSFIFSTLR